MFTWSDSACWILVIVLALAIEAFTLNLSAIWFAVGGIGSLIATTLQCSIPVQWIVFLVVSGVSLVGASHGGQNDWNKTDGNQRRSNPWGAGDGYANHFQSGCTRRN